MQIRDVHGEFEGAEFRDPETQLMFAYDYEGRHSLRVHGHNMKPCLHKEIVAPSGQDLRQGDGDQSAH